MKMEVLAIQQQYQSQYSVMMGSNKVKDWTSTLTTPTNAAVVSSTEAASAKTKQAAAANNLPYLQNNTTNKIKNSINKKTKRTAEAVNSKARSSSSTAAAPTYNNNNLFYCDEDIDANSDAVLDLSARLLDELRAAKSRHLTCTEVSLPCDLTPRIAAEILRVSAKEPCGIRGCTIYIEFEDEPNNSRRIASLKLDAETVSTFEIYLTLRQDHRGWTALLPQFMKSLARTITISPEFTITKHKLYLPHQQRVSYSYGNSSSTTSTAISTAAGGRAAQRATISTTSS